MRVDLSWLPWTVSAVLLVLCVAQARVVALQRSALRLAWQRLAQFKSELETANQLMAAVSRDKLAEKGTAR